MLGAQIDGVATRVAPASPTRSAGGDHLHPRHQPPKTRQFLRRARSEVAPTEHRPLAGRRADRCDAVVVTITAAILTERTWLRLATVAAGRVGPGVGSSIAELDSRR